MKEVEKMKEVELIIRMPEEKYNILKGDLYRTLPVEWREWGLEAIRNGIKIPEGHGKIADVDKVYEEMKATRTYDIGFAMERVKPLIEADKTKDEAEESLENPEEDMERE